MKQIFLILAPLLVTIVAFAGPISSGGGKGVVCRDPHGKVTSVELLDLWEARILYKRSITKSTLPVAAQVDAAIDRLKYSVDIGGAIMNDVKYTAPQYFVKLVSKRAHQFTQNSSNVQYMTGVTLTLSDDSYELARPTDCGIEQIITYVDSIESPQIVVNKTLFDKMDSENQSALIVHESFYSMMRENFMEADSLRVRRAVGYVFAGNSFQDINSFLGPSYLECVAGSTVDDMTSNVSNFYFYKTPSGKTKLMMSTLWDSPSIGFFEMSDGYDYSDFLALDDSYCTNTQPTANGFRGAIQSNVGGWGPVDYTKSARLVWTCDKDNKLGIYIMRGDFDPSNPKVTEKFTCFTENYPR